MRLLPRSLSRSNLRASPSSTSLSASAQLNSTSVPPSPLPPARVPGASAAASTPNLLESTAQNESTLHLPRDSHEHQHTALSPTPSTSSLSHSLSHGPDMTSTYSRATGTAPNGANLNGTGSTGSGSGTKILRSLSVLFKSSSSSKDKPKRSKSTQSSPNPKLTKAAKRQTAGPGLGQGIGHTAPPSSARQARRGLSFDSDLSSSSREPSLDIRPPSGLGAFGSLPSTPITPIPDPLTGTPAVSTPARSAPAAQILNSTNPVSSVSVKKPGFGLTVPAILPPPASARKRHARRHSSSEIQPSTGLSVPIPIAGSEARTSVSAQSNSAWPIPPGHARFATTSEIIDARIESAKLPPEGEDMGVSPAPTFTPLRCEWFRLEELPDEVLEGVMDNLGRGEVLGVMSVCRKLGDAGRGSLYGSIELGELDVERRESLLKTLLRRKDLAELVRRLVLPPAHELDGEVEVVQRVLRRCTNLRHLSTADLEMMHHAPWTLRSLTLSSTSLSRAEHRDLWTRLAARPGIMSLSLTRLVVRRSSDENEEEGPDGDVPPNLLPGLSSITAPPSIVRLLVPARPITHALITLDASDKITAMDAAAISVAVKASSGKIISTGVRASPGVSGETLEKVLGAVGVEVGRGVRELEVSADLSEEVLYKHLSAVGGSYPKLRLLRLCPPGSQTTSSSGSNQGTPVQGGDLHVEEPEDDEPDMGDTTIRQQPSSSHLGLALPSPASVSHESFHSTTSALASRPVSAIPTIPTPITAPNSPLPVAPSIAPTTRTNNTTATTASTLSPTHLSTLRLLTKFAPKLRVVVFPNGLEWRIVRIKAPPNSRAASAVWGKTRKVGPVMVLKGSTSGTASVQSPTVTSEARSGGRRGANVSGMSGGTATVVEEEVGTGAEQVQGQVQGRRSRSRTRGDSPTGSSAPPSAWHGPPPASSSTALAPSATTTTVSGNTEMPSAVNGTGNAGVSRSQSVSSSSALGGGGGGGIGGTISRIRRSLSGRRSGARMSTELLRAPSMATPEISVSSTPSTPNKTTTTMPTSKSTKRRSASVGRIGFGITAPLSFVSASSRTPEPAELRELPQPALVSSPHEFSPSMSLRSNSSSTGIGAVDMQRAGSGGSLSPGGVRRSGSKMGSIRRKPVPSLEGAGSPPLSSVGGTKSEAGSPVIEPSTSATVRPGNTASPALASTSANVLSPTSADESGSATPPRLVSPQPNVGYAPPPLPPLLRKERPALKLPTPPPEEPSASTSTSTVGSNGAMKAPVPASAADRTSPAAKRRMKLLYGGKKAVPGLALEQKDVPLEREWERGW